MSGGLLTGHVLVLGLGVSGLETATYLAARACAGEDVRVTVVDENDTPLLRERAETLRVRGVEVILGNAEPAPADLVVASPGIPPASPLMRAARALGVPVISEIELAFRRSASPWVAITGTNGKTTTTSLVGHLLGEAGVPVAVVGNIGEAAIASVDEAGPTTVLVAEVSSFQLALTDRFRPRVSVLLNITPDHLDWHGSMETYAADKGRIFANQAAGDTAVIDVDDELSAPFADTASAGGARVARVSLEGTPVGGAGLDGDMLSLGVHGAHVPLIARSELLIRGDHNVSNALAAAAAVAALGVPAEDIAKGLRSFRPIEHRLEPAGVVDDVEYFNDSKATNPDAVLKALAAFEAEPLVVLLGGRNKDNDFRPLAAACAERCKAVVTFGEAGEEIASAFPAEGPRPERAETMAEAVAAARRLAEPGDVVLLSPACASFDEFSGYAERGRVFKTLVAGMGEAR